MPEKSAQMSRQKPTSVTIRNGGQSWSVGGRAGVAFGLAFRGDHRGRPTIGAAPRSAALHALCRCLTEEIEIVLACLGGAAIGVGTLLRLEDERTAAVAVDASEAGRAVAVVGEHAALEHVIVGGIVGAAAIGGGHAENVAESVDEGPRVGEL